MQETDVELFCKIFLDSDFDRETVLERVVDITGGSRERSTVTNENINLDVLKNDNFDEVKRLEIPDGFLYFRYLIEVEPNESVDSELYIASVAQLLEGIWKLGCKAVAACDFEDLLPRKGGYRQ